MFGHRGKIILKAVGERASKALREQVLRRMDGGGLAAQPVAHENESTGSVGNGVKSFKGLFRVHLIAPERSSVRTSYLSPYLKLVGRVRWRYLDQVLAGCRRHKRLRATLWQKEPGRALCIRRSCLVAQTSRSDASGALPTVSSSAWPSSACHWLTGGRVSWWTQCGRPDGSIQHQLPAPLHQQSSRVLPNLAGTCPEGPIYVLMTFGGSVIRHGAADVH